MKLAKSPEKCNFGNRVTIPPEKMLTGYYSQTEANFVLKLQILSFCTLRYMNIEYGQKSEP